MKIPKIFHTIWIGGNPFPEEFEFYLNTWKEKHPDWEFRFWTDDNLPPLRTQKLFDSVEGIVLKADILKINLLYKFGGVFIDADFECYKNIEPLIENLEIFSAAEEAGLIGNAIMGGTPKHRVFKKILRAMPKSIKENADYGPNIKTGPVFMARTLTFDEIYVFSPHYFFPTKPGYRSERGLSELYPDAYANHHWAGSWVEVEERKNWAEWSQKYKKRKTWDKVIK